MRKNRWFQLAIIATLVLSMGTLAGCKGKKGDELDLPDLSSDNTGMSDGSGSDNGGFSEGLNSGIDQDSLLFNPDSPGGLQTVFFDYNSFALRSDALAILSRNAELLKGRPNVLVQIAGHCDERGTSEYNMALGEKRALAVREHLMRLGVAGDRMITISYGEEWPVAMGSSESAWSQNRRCQFAQAQAL